ncbi:MAG: hypothetical protein ACE5FI_18280 [Anaerolineales bacterium]
MTVSEEDTRAERPVGAIRKSRVAASDRGVRLAAGRNPADAGRISVEARGVFFEAADG